MIVCITQNSTYTTHTHFIYTRQLIIGTEQPGSGPYIHSSYIYFMHAFFINILQLIIGDEHPGSGPYINSPYIHSSYIYFMHAFFINILLELQLIIGTEQPMHMAQVPGPKSHTRIAQRARAGTEGSSCSRCECICRAGLFFGFDIYI